ncbi:MAG: PPC domain-containing protein [Euryarchaeota archaeon]|nr:PPC domain-containing protein [Euryarchaeota archaeon]
METVPLYYDQDPSLELHAIPANGTTGRHVLVNDQGLIEITSWEEDWDGELSVKEESRDGGTDRWLDLPIDPVGYSRWWDSNDDYQDDYEALRRWPYYQPIDHFDPDPNDIWKSDDIVQAVFHELGGGVTGYLSYYEAMYQDRLEEARDYYRSYDSSHDEDETEFSAIKSKLHNHFKIKVDEETGRPVKEFFYKYVLDEGTTGIAHALDYEGYVSWELPTGWENTVRTNIYSAVDEINELQFIQQQLQSIRAAKKDFYTLPLPERLPQDKYILPSGLWWYDCAVHPETCDTEGVLEGGPIHSLYDWAHRIQDDDLISAYVPFPDKVYILWSSARQDPQGSLTLRFSDNSAMTIPIQENTNVRYFMAGASDDWWGEGEGGIGGGLPYPPPEGTHAEPAVIWDDGAGNFHRIDLLIIYIPEEEQGVLLRQIEFEPQDTILHLYHIVVHSKGNVYELEDTLDGDSDGMADRWENHYFGNMSRDGAGDYDNDGFSDLQEYQEGTLPIMLIRSCGLYYGSIDDGELYDLYWLQVPEGAETLGVKLDGEGMIPPDEQSNVHLDCYLWQGELPGPPHYYDVAGHYISNPQGEILSERICEVSDPTPGERYYLMVYPYAGTGDYTLTVFTATTIERGVTTGYICEPSDMYQLQVPPDLDELIVRLEDIPHPANLDLYVRQGQKPTTAHYDCRSALGGENDEMCKIEDPTEGVYYLMVDRVGDICGNYTLKVDFVEEVDWGVDYYESFPAHEPPAYDLYRVLVRPGQLLLRAWLDVPPGADFDLLVRQGTPPEATAGGFDCVSSNQDDADEICELANPQSGWYYLMVNRYGEGTGDYTLRVDFVDPISIGSGEQSGPISANELSDLYELNVETELALLRVELVEEPSGAEFGLLLRQGESPEDIGSDIYWALCELENPSLGQHYLRVYRYEGTGEYTLKVEFVTPEPTPTHTPTLTNTPTATSTPLKEISEKLIYSYDDLICAMRCT